MFRKEDEGKCSSLTHFQAEEVPSTFLVSIFLPPLTFSGNPAALCHCFSGAHLHPSHKPCPRQIPLIWGGKGSPTVRDWLYPQEIGAGTKECNQLSGNQNSQQKSQQDAFLPGQAVAVSSLLLMRLPLATRVSPWKVGIFFLTSYHLMAGKSSVSEED